jgi:hypothetical protein
MKTLIVLISVMLSAGCKSITEESVVGTYRYSGKFLGSHPLTAKFDFLQNGKYLVHVSSKSLSTEFQYDGSWKIIGNEVHAEGGDFASTRDVKDFGAAVFKIETNGDLTEIALIENGKRTELREDQQIPYKKLKKKGGKED